MPREYDIPVSAPVTTTTAADTTPATKPLVNLSTLTTDELKVIRANAASQGMSVEQYLTSRQGIDEMGYFGDVPAYAKLTAEERKSLTLPDGTIDSAGMLALLDKKEYNFYYDKIKQENPGWTEENIKRFATDMMNFKNRQGGIGGMGGFGGTSAGGGGGGGYNAQGIPTPGGQYNAQGQFVGNGGAGTPEQIAERKSAYDLLYQQFNQYGLGALVEPLKNLVLENVSPSEFTIRLRETDAYKKRFAANAARIANGLSALSEAQYLDLEDGYQEIMRRYGLPESYYSRGEMGRQEGFEKFIGGDVSLTELEDRIQTAQRRVINAAPEISAALRTYYPEIGQGEMIAYFLDPKKAIEDIRRKVTAAEIGAGAAMSGLETGVARAEELARYGVTGEAARQGYQTIADVVPRGSQLAEFYKQSPYTQTTAEQEVFGLTGATEASKQRRKLTQLEQATFSGSAGTTGGALARDRAGAF